MRRLIQVTIGLLILTQTSLAFQNDAFFNRYYQMADESFNQAEAFETVAFVEKFWRLMYWKKMQNLLIDLLIE